LTEITGSIRYILVQAVNPIRQQEETVPVVLRKPLALALPGKVNIGWSGADLHSQKPNASTVKG